MPGPVPRIRHVASALAAVLVAACAPREAPRHGPPSEAAPALGTRPWSAVDPEWLARRPADPVEAAAQLDVALDAFDAARLLRDDGARERLEAYVGPWSPSHGPLATAEVTERLLARALDVADAAATRLGTDHAAHAFAADAVTLLAADTYMPVDAEELLARVEAYRTVVALGTAPAADNARLRLFDFVRGVLADAAAAPAPRRYEIASFALLVAGRDPAPILARPPRATYPAPQDLVQILYDPIEPLVDTAVWGGTIGTLRQRAERLAGTTMALLPAPRRPLTELVGRIAPPVPPGFLPSESLAPVVVVRDGKAAVDPGHPAGVRIRLDADRGAALAAALEGALARDGRNRLLLVADAVAPPRDLAAVLSAIRRVGVDLVEVAVRPADLGGAPPRVVTVLPLQVASSDGPFGRAVARARIQVDLDGRGPRIGFDGATFTEPAGDPGVLSERLDLLARAFPREDLLRLHVGDDVTAPLLVEVLAAALGRARPEASARFGAVVMVPDAESWPATRTDASPLTVRARLGRAEPRVRPPYPLRREDAEAMGRAAARAQSCLPELAGNDRRRRRLGTVRVALAYDGGVLQKVAPKAPRRPPDAFLACIHATFGPVRLTRHKESFTVLLEADVPPPEPGQPPGEGL